MARILVFADESGNFTFSNKHGASEYFILTTVTFFDDYATCGDLLALRHQLAMEGRFSGPFHAMEDTNVIRARVFETIKDHSFRIDVTVLQKRRADPQIRPSEERFYQYVWYYHMRYVAPRICSPRDELLVVASTIGTRAKANSFHAGVKDVMRQTSPAASLRTAHWLASTHPGLQVADYASWAIQRKWEQGDSRWFSIIAANVQSEFEIFKTGTTNYY